MADEHRALFVYGTLMFDAVLVTLLKRLPKSHPARLKGYRRFAIRDRVYPAIVPEAGSSVCGLVLLGLTAEERRILDEFEDEDYIKTPLTVHVHAALANAIDTGTGAATAAGAGIAAAGTSVDASATFRSSMCATTQPRNPSRGLEGRQPPSRKDKACALPLIQATSAL